MFEFIRKHSKMVMILLFLLIIPSFVIVGGLDRYNMFNQQGETVATVDGHNITRQDWDNAHQREVERVRASNPGVDPALFDSPQARYATLEGLVRDRVLAAAAQKSLLNTTDARLARVLMQDPALARPEGGVDTEKYKALVAAQGMTPAMFEAKLRSDISQRQVLFGVAGTAFSPQSVVDVTLNTYLERREVQVARVKTSDFASKVNPTDADIEAYYKAHESDYKAPEEASIEYVVLDPQAIQNSITVDEAALKDFYAKYAAAEAAKEERRTSHIMVNSPASDSKEKRAAAKAKAEQLLAQVRKAPDTFADVAKKNSEDPGSASNGGDLDYSRRGGYVSKSLENAAFGLKAKGDISGVVESEFGYHVVKLTDIRVPKVASYEEQRPKLENEYRLQEAQRKYSEAAESFTNTVYEQSDSLKPVVDKFKLQIMTASNVMRTPMPGANGPLANPKFLTALFSPDSLEKHRNTEALEVGPSQLASGRVVKHTPARTQPLAEVKNQVKAALVAQRAEELAKADGEAKLKAWQADPVKAQMSAATIVSREQPGDLAGPALDAALRADTTKLPALVGVEQAPQGYVIVKVNKVMPRVVPPAEQGQQERAQFSQLAGAAENLAYYELLKQRFKVKITVAKPDDGTANTVATR